MNPVESENYDHLPGGEYIAQGLRDLAAAKETLPALLLSIASVRLADAGLALPAVVPAEPELRLYRLLRTEHGDESHSQYNAHLRRLTSLCRALEARANSISKHS